MTDRTARTIEVFRPGTFRPLTGEPITYSAADLATVAAAYDAASAPAPVVVGHPAVDAPAFGWIAGLRWDETAQRLYADVDELEPAFADAVAAGRYRRVSLSFFRPDSPANPKPGTWYPKHLGFLGAAPPAVTGLRPVHFAGGADDAVTVEFAAGAREAAGLFRRLREFFIDRFSLEEADRVLPEYEIRWLDDVGRDDRPAPAFTSPSEPEVPLSDPATDPATGPSADFAAREAAIAEREAALAERQRRIAHEGNVAFAAALVSEGRMLPAQETELVAVLDAVEAAPADPAFAATEGSAAAALRSLLRSLPAVVPYGQTLPRGERPGTSVDFAAPEGLTVDGDRLAIHAKALAYQAAHPGTDYLAAVRAVDAGA